MPWYDDLDNKWYDELQREREEDEHFSFGDPRRCPIHGEITSSPDGMFDAPCGACEYEIEHGHEDQPEPRPISERKPSLPVEDDDIPF